MVVAHEPDSGYNAVVPSLHAAHSQPATGLRDRLRAFRYTKAIVAAVLAFAAMGVSTTLGNIHSHDLSPRLFALIGALAFLICAVVAVRSLAGDLAKAVDLHAGRDGGTVVRIVVSVTGFVLIAFVALGLLSVSVQHLLIGGALTGVILGIAGQQALGNLFAGIVLLTARPFTLDEHVRVRSGSLGGVFDGVIRRIGLAYVTIETADGTVNVPNSVMLSVGVGPAPPGAPDIPLAGPTSDRSSPIAPVQLDAPVSASGTDDPPAI
jgi:small-conductance mechanosensitive channel